MGESENIICNQTIIINPKYLDDSYYEECERIASAGTYYRIDCNASVPGQIVNSLGQPFKYAVVLGSNLQSTPDYFKGKPGLKPDGPFFVLRITRDDSSHGARHENTDEKIIWKTCSGHCLSINKKNEGIPDHRVDYLFGEILEASPLRILKGEPAPNPPNKAGTWQEYSNLCASLNNRELFE